MKEIDTECPAEFVITSERFGRYSWAVCQPDAAWGEYYSGVVSSYEDAKKLASHYLAVVHRKQGY